MAGVQGNLFFDLVAKEWAEDWFLRSTNEVKINLTGPVLGVVSANLRDSILPNSRVNSDGFTIGTNVDYGVYWEGTEEGLVDTQRSGLGGNSNVPARSFIREVLERNIADMQVSLSRLYERRLPAMFPDTAVFVRFDLSGL
jgi:hypothetical protein